MTALCDLAGLYVGHPTFIEGLRDAADREGALLREQVEIVVDASLPPGVVEIRSAGLRYWMDVSSGGGA